MESINLTEPFDKIDQNVNFGGEIIVFREDKVFKWLFHWGNCGEVANNLLGGLNNNILVEVIVLIHVGQECKEAVLIEHLDIISFVFVENIAQVDFEETVEHGGVNLINDFGVLNNSKNGTMEM